LKSNTCYHLIENVFDKYSSCKIKNDTNETLKLAIDSLNSFSKEWKIDKDACLNYRYKHYHFFKDILMWCIGFFSEKEIRHYLGKPNTLIKKKKSKYRSYLYTIQSLCRKDIPKKDRTLCFLEIDFFGDKNNVMMGYSADISCF